MGLCEIIRYVTCPLFKKNAYLCHHYTSIRPTNITKYNKLLCSDELWSARWATLEFGLYIMYDKDYNIVTIKDVQDFAKFLYNERGEAFHPDDDFADYENCETHEPTFSESEISLYNRLMEQCFHVCEQNGRDIYSVMIEFHSIYNATN